LFSRKYLGIIINLLRNKVHLFVTGSSCIAILGGQNDPNAVIVYDVATKIIQQFPVGRRCKRWPQDLYGSVG